VPLWKFSRLCPLGSQINEKVELWSGKDKYEKFEKDNMCSAKLANLDEQNGDLVT
jgi:hypothetical protein